MEKKYRSLINILNTNEPPIFWTVFILIISFRIWLITGIPNKFMYMPHDDLYFAKAAHYILHDQWLGPYSQMTIIKTPFFSFFLILSFFTGLSLILNETFFYIVACIVLFIAFSPLIKNRWKRLIFFIITLFIPASLATNSLLRVYRDYVYITLTLFVVAFTIGFYLRMEQKLSKLFIWAIGLGLSMGAFMLTREEGIWIYPVLLCFLLFCLLMTWIRKVDRRIIRSSIILLPILLWYLPILTVSYLNYSHYGFWGISETLDTDFNRVFNTLARIKTAEPWHPAIQISAKAREKAYAVSPILMGMKNDIEKAVINWNGFDDDSMRLKPGWYLLQYGNNGSEIGNGHFTWLFRDVVASKGYYSNGKYPSEYYKQIIDQLETACGNGALDCTHPKNIPLIGSIDTRHYPIILRMTYDGIIDLLRQDFTSIDTLNIYQWPKWPANNNEYRYFDQLVHNPVNIMAIGPNQDSQGLINGKTDVRFKFLQNKAKFMGLIRKIFRNLSVPFFAVACITWIFFLILLLIRKFRRDHEQFMVISLFILGLLFARVLTLTILDATSSISGIPYYGLSILVYIYIFMTLMIFWLCDLQKNIFRKQA